jgi:alkyl hydroperoxide reductase subunit F
MYDLIVIGGGPAGLTSTIYAIRKRLDVLMVTRDLGGKTNYHLSLPWIEDYQVIRGLEVVNKFKSELEYLKFARHMDTVDQITREAEGFTVLSRDGSKLQTKAVILATGTRQKRLDVPGEKEYIMKGLCYSALSYAPLFIDKKTIVIGDGELALRSAGELATVADQVVMVCESGAGLETSLGNKLVKASNVIVLEGHHVIEVQGDEFAKSVLLKDPNGNPVTISADGIFIEMALLPNSSMVANLVKLDEQGRIFVDTSNRTNVPGIFAAGDVTTTYAEQVLVAVGEGAKAALSAYDYLLPML